MNNSIPVMNELSEEARKHNCPADLLCFSKPSLDRHP
jgi:hypothetical protein